MAQRLSELTRLTEEFGGYEQEKRQMTMFDRILVTGGTGSLGSACVKRWTKRDVTKVCLYSRDEDKQEKLLESLDDSARKVVTSRLGDVRDARRIQQVVREFQPTLIVHAAALKRVPACESEIEETIATNVQGSLNVLDAAALIPGVRVVGISTDKAVAPINTMGLSKALMERAFIQRGQPFVRYGNVLGSRGSVLHVFQRQLRAEGVVTVTDPMMTRFLLTLDTAVDIIEVAAMLGKNVVPKLLAATMEDFANAAIAVFAPRTGSVRIVGPRPGEKRHESLLNEHESWVQFPPGCAPGMGVVVPRIDDDNERKPFSSDSADKFSPVGLENMIADWVWVAESSHAQ